MIARTEITPGRVPSVTLGCRLRMALAGRTVLWIAAELGVDPSTASHWLNDKTVPKLGMIRAWAMICGVDYDWLRTGLDPSEQAAA